MTDSARLQEIRYYRYSLRRWWFYQIWGAWWSLRTVLIRALGDLWPADASAWHIAFFAGCIGILLTILLFLESPDVVARHWNLSFRKPLMAATEVDSSDPEIDTRWPFIDRNEQQPKLMAEFQFGDRHPTRTQHVPPTPDLKLVTQTWQYVAKNNSRNSSPDIHLVESSYFDDSRLPSAKAPQSSSDRWVHFQKTQDNSTNHQPYIERISLQATSGSQRTPIWDGIEGSQLLSASQVSAQLRITTPELVAARDIANSTLEVINTGNSPLGSIRIEESLDSLPTVLDASPSAKLDARNLVRQLIGVGKGQKQTLSLEWLADRSGKTSHRARAVFQTAVYAATQVDLPTETDSAPGRPEPLRRLEPVLPASATIANGLELRVKHRGILKVGDSTVIEIEVFNPNPNELQGVVLTAELDNKVIHKQGALLDYPLGDIGPQETRHATLKLRGQQVGEAISRITVASENAPRSIQQLVLIVEASSLTPATSTPIVTPVVSPPISSGPCGCTVSLPTLSAATKSATPPVVPSVTPTVNVPQSSAVSQPVNQLPASTPAQPTE